MSSARAHIICAGTTVRYLLILRYPPERSQIKIIFSSSQMIKVTSIAAYKTYSCNIDKNASVLVTVSFYYNNTRIFAGFMTFDFRSNRI